jgi:hypothetical protein
VGVVLANDTGDVGENAHLKGGKFDARKCFYVLPRGSAIWWGYLMAVVLWVVASKPASQHLTGSQRLSAFYHCPSAALFRQFSDDARQTPTSATSLSLSLSRATSSRSPDPTDCPLT